MKVRCIKDFEYRQVSVDDFARIPDGEILETDNSGIIECLRDFKGDFVISLDDDDFFEYFEIIEGEDMKNIVKYEGSEFQDKKVRYGMLFETELGLCIMSQTNEETYQLISLEDGNRMDDVNYKHSKISQVDGSYLGYGIITVSDFRKE